MDYAGLLPVSSGLFSPVISAAKKCGALDFSAFSYCASDRSAFRHVVMKKPRPQPPTALPRAVRFLLAPPPPAVRTEACHRSAPDRGPPGPSALGVPDETGMQPNTADPAFEYPDRQAGEGTFPHLLSVPAPAVSTRPDEDIRPLRERNAQLGGHAARKNHGRPVRVCASRRGPPAHPRGHAAQRPGGPHKKAGQ